MPERKDIKDVMFARARACAEADGLAEITFDSKAVTKEGSIECAFFVDPRGLHFRVFEYKADQRGNLLAWKETDLNRESFEDNYPNVPTPKLQEDLLHPRYDTVV